VGGLALPRASPNTDDPLVSAFARRSLIVMRTATDNASGAIVASIDTQGPYGEDWVRDGSFINHALDVAGFHDTVGRHERFSARVQRKQPAGWSPLYTFPPCDPAHPQYPNCSRRPSRRRRKPSGARRRTRAVDIPGVYR